MSKREKSKVRPIIIIHTHFLAWTMKSRKKVLADSVALRARDMRSHSLGGTSGFVATTPSGRTPFSILVLCKERLLCVP